jgi:preprotein translocase subunit SecD
LGSGNLPAKAVVESKSQFPASVGGKFLEYSFIIGIISLVVVALVIFIRYRVVYIVLPTVFTGLAEIIITLGVAALLNWELDLAGVAGIIAAVGTGVNDQIIINDEALRRKTKEEKDTNVFEQIRKAFFIIFTAAATIIAVMVPLFSIQALKGFAFMTIIGVFIGVLLTRPAYAKFVEAVRE